MTEVLYNDSELQMDTTLILCIEEHDSKSNPLSIDTRMFIGWSNIDKDYYIRGKRQDIGSKEFVPYAFHCETTNDVYDFIEFAVGNRVSVTLYNYNNLLDVNNDDDNDYDYENITYEFFDNNMDRNYEIAAYDYIKPTRRHFTKFLRILKHAYNWEKINKP